MIGSWEQVRGEIVGIFTVHENGKKIAVLVRSIQLMDCLLGFGGAAILIFILRHDVFGKNHGLLSNKVHVCHPFDSGFDSALNVHQMFVS